MSRKCRNPKCDVELETGDGTYDGYCDQNCKWTATRMNGQQLQLHPAVPSTRAWGCSPRERH